jgi:tetratricopeptide (TPR) repeat protein
MAFRSTGRLARGAAVALCLLALAPFAAGSRAEVQGETQSEQAPAQQEPPRNVRDARQARIEAYLKKRAERAADKQRRRAEREARLQERHRLAAEARAQADDAEAAARAARAHETVERVEPMADAQESSTPSVAAATAAAGGGRVRPPSGSFGKTQKRLRQSQLGQDPTVRSYLDLFDTGEATPAQYAAFANFLAQNGLYEDALAYYDRALRVEPKNPLLWLNLGTLLRQSDHLSEAVDAYAKAIKLDPNNALAHYNMGVALHLQDRYDEAIEEFSVALRLDPSLADPEKNPQVVNNELLLPVKLRMLRNQTGTLGLPLVEVPEDRPPETAGPEQEPPK